MFDPDDHDLENWIDHEDLETGQWIDDLIKEQDDDDYDDDE